MTSLIRALFGWIVLLALLASLLVPEVAQAVERRGAFLYEGGVVVGYLSGEFLFVNGVAVGRVREGILYSMDGRYSAPLPADPNEEPGRASPQAPPSPTHRAPSCGYVRESPFSFIYVCQ